MKRIKNKNSFSRRDFVKTGMASVAAATGAGALGSCGIKTGDQRQESLPLLKNEEWKPGDGPAGVLFSQIGYDPGYPVKVIVRIPRKDFLTGNPVCRLIPSDGENEYETGCTYWGEIWKSHWWVAEFTSMKEEGKWVVEICSEGKCIYRDGVLRVKRNILWDRTIEWSSVDMLERRRHFTKVGAGWQDAGTLWVESPAQSAMIIALSELLEKSRDRFNESFTERIVTQLQVGCDYLVMTQEKAAEMGFSRGAFTHDLHGHEKDILPNDAMKAVVALAKTARLLPDKLNEKKKKYADAAKQAFQWLINEARPMGAYGYMKMQRGLPEKAVIPTDEWLTRDLLTMSWAAHELFRLGIREAGEKAVEFARKAIARQIPEEKAESGFYGHFYEFDSMNHSEPSWIHGIVPSPSGTQFGADMGGVYPNYLMPVIELLKQFPEHEDAGLWKQALTDFTYGYLIPGCKSNPFSLVPQGIFGQEGPIWFCGTFHGTNAIYGYTAALALELAKVLDDSELKNIACGNLQWFAGLNSGITAENIRQGCVVYSTDLPEGAALPASMICHIGNRWAGTWFQTRGVICNGFSTGEQFKYDTKPVKENDGPFSLTDEDWIPHSAGWLTGIMRM